MAVSRRLRFEILRRDGYTCRYCGAKAPDVTLTVDHVLPVALGGGDEPQNLVTACTDCNSGKTSIQPDSPIVEDVDATAMLFAKAIEQAADRRRADKVALEAQLQGFYDKWTEWKWGDSQTVPLPNDWHISIERFIANGLTLEDMAPLIHDTMSLDSVRDEFRFFCHKAWQEIAERQELARRLLEDGEV